MDRSDNPIELGPDGEEEVCGDAETRVDKVRLDCKRPAVAFTGKPVWAESEKDITAVCGCRVAEGNGAGLALDRTAVAAGRAEGV